MWSTVASWVSSGWTKVLPWIAGLGAIFTVLVSVKQSGINAQKAEDQQNEIKSEKAAIKIDQQVNYMSDADITSKLHEYYRD